MDKFNRVVITGMGVVTPIGNNIEEFWNGCVEGKSGIRPIEKFDVNGYRTKIAAQVCNFDPEKIFGRQKAAGLGRFSQFAMSAVAEAIQKSRLELTDEEKKATGIICGTSQGGLAVTEEQYKIFFSKGLRHGDPLAVPKGMHVAAASNLAIHYGLKGPNYTICTTCSSGAIAIGEAYRLIKHGYARTMIAGGTDACITPGMLGAWCKLRALSVQNDCPERACKPFSKNRDGLVMGEGAGFFVLESLDNAIKRDAPLMGELIGYGINNDAFHLTFPSAEGEVEAINLALKDASLASHEIDYINAHGTATQINDRGETKAIKKVFGEKSYSIPISSTKSMIGHTLGAAGAIEMVATTLAVKDGILPPTINYEEPDPECDLDYVPNKSRRKNINIAVSNSFGFGGTNAVLVVKNCTDLKY